MNRLSKTESAVFLNCRFSLFMRDPFSRLFRVVVCVLKLLHVHRYSVDIFSSSGLSGILGSDESRLPLKPV